MPWLLFTSYRRNQSKYLYAIVSLVLTTFIATVSVGSLEFASAVYKKPILEYSGGHIILRLSGVGDELFYPSRVFEKDRVVQIVKEVFPEASVTATLVVPATYPDEAGSLIGAPGSHIAGRSDNLDSWYLFPTGADGIPLASVPADEPSVIYAATYRIAQATSGGRLPDAHVRIARYAGTDYPWQMANTEVRTLRIVGTCKGAGYLAYMRLEALREITGCPEGIVSMIGVAFPGIQDRANPAKLEQLKSLLAEEMPEMMVITVEDIGEAFVSGVEFLRSGPRMYLPIVYGVSFGVVAAILSSVAHSRRRELQLLRTIGLNHIQVRLLFGGECVIASALAGVVGYYPIVLTTRIALRCDRVSLLPLVITLVGATIIAMLESALLLGREVRYVEGVE